MTQPMTIEQVAEHARRRIMAAHDRTKAERAAAAAEWEALVTATETALADFPAATPVNLAPTPDVGVWFDPSTGALVRIPAGARTAVAS